MCLAHRTSCYRTNRATSGVTQSLRPPREKSAETMGVRGSRSCYRRSGQNHRASGGWARSTAIDERCASPTEQAAIAQIAPRVVSHKAYDRRARRARRPWACGARGAATGGQGKLTLCRVTRPWCRGCQRGRWRRSLYQRGVRPPWPGGPCGWGDSRSSYARATSQAFAGVSGTLACRMIARPPSGTIVRTIVI